MALASVTKQSTEKGTAREKMLVEEVWDMEPFDAMALKLAHADALASMLYGEEKTGEGFLSSPAELQDNVLFLLHTLIREAREALNRDLDARALARSTRADS